MTDSASHQGNEPKSETVTAGVLSPWTVDELPRPLKRGWREWRTFIGPGMLLAGASIGAGEWLFGPAVSAQFGAMVMWLATISIVCQVFLNLEVMRYALYCGEPILVGFFRTWPGARLWTLVYLLMEFSNVFPFMASNSAVPLSAAMLGHLPGDAMTTFLGLSLSESQLVRVLGYVVFFLSFVPLFFGRVIYRMIELLMTFKIVLVLGYLGFVVVFMVSARNIGDVVTGFFRFGSVPFRADSVIDGRHFTWTEREGSVVYTVKGTIENGQPIVTEFRVGGSGEAQKFALGEAVPPELQSQLRSQVATAQSLARPGRFLVEHTDGDLTLRAEGRKAPDGAWQPTGFLVTESGVASRYDRLEEVPEPAASRFRDLIKNRGAETGNLLTYFFKHGQLPDLDWTLLAAFFAIAGAGGMANSLFSNYTRDKGWGMGGKTGAIPSAIGGRMITLSHVGKVFRVSPESVARWRGWIRYIVTDQTAVWITACFVGMALPCMLSIEFIRNAPVAGNRVAAMTADGISSAYPAYGALLWPLTLLCGFLVLAPGATFSADSLARRWTDIIWVVNPQVKKMKGNQVKYIYYGILVAYIIWGTFALSLFDPLTLAKYAAGISNLALGVSAVHTLYVNRKFLPPELRPGWFMQLGLALCAISFLGIAALGLPQLFRTWFPGA